MPPIASLASTSAGVLSALVSRAGNGSGPGIASATSQDSSSLQVICAWPVSGQYGPGSRALYYTLVATCVFARKAEWLRDACIAAALLLPAVAALHGVVLAGMHVDEAVDMDVFGAFQLSSIAVLAAPVTLRRSSTYFYGSGRNLIFVWTIMLLAGIFSLFVELYRSRPLPCKQDGLTIKNFPYGDTEDEFCGLRCSQDNGPSSTMRKGATGEIYVIPAPKYLGFGTATLIAGGCCIISVLSLVDIFNKIRHDSGVNKPGGENDDKNPSTENTISGTNGATPKLMESVEKQARFLMGAIEIPFFALAILAILITGELNFNSEQLRWGTEPIENVGQWGPIVTASLAAIGSLYMLFEARLREYRKRELRRRSTSTTQTVKTTAEAAAVARLRRSATNDQSRPGSPSELRRGSTSGSQIEGETDVIGGSREKINKALYRIADFLGTPKPDSDQSYRQGRASEFPEIPGERFKYANVEERNITYGSTRGLALSRASIVRSALWHEGGEGPDSPKTSEPSRSPITGESSFFRKSQSPRRGRQPIPTLKIQEPSPSRSRPSRVGTSPASSQAGSQSKPTTVGGSQSTRRHTLEAPSAASWSSHVTSAGNSENHPSETQASPGLHASSPSSPPACCEELSTAPPANEPQDPPR